MMAKQVDLKIQEALRRKLAREGMAVEARTSFYNPLLQKPVALEPVGPGSYPAGMGGYAYIGPPPDFGGSYGAYEDTSGRKQYGVKTNRQYSIYDGSPVSLKSELNPAERDALLSQLEDVSTEYKCESCRAELLVSAFIDVQSVHCPYCSSEMSGGVEKIKECYSKLEEKNMKTEQAKAAQTVKAEADLAKEAMKIPSPAEQNEDFKEPSKKVEELQHKDSQKDATQVEVVKESEGDTGKEVKSGLQADQARKERLMAAAKETVRRRRAKILAAKKADKTEGSLNLTETAMAELKRELRIMATLQPEKFAVMKTNPKVAAVCAEVEKKLYTASFRKQVRAELAGLFAKDAKAAEEYKEQLDFVAPEILMEEDVEHKEEKHAESAKEETMPEALKEEAKKHEHEEEAPKAEKEEAAKADKEEEEKKEEASKKEDEAADKAQAMQTETLLSKFDGLTCERIEMSLHGENTPNPFWNVIVDAQPVGRIFLNDQPDANTIHAAFTSDEYATNFANAVNKAGLTKMLSLVKAHLFAHELDETEATARIREKVKAEVKAEFSKKLETLRQDFVMAARTAMVAADKNLYANEENAHALKGGLFQAAVTAGLTSEAAEWVVEAGFQSSAQYLDFVTKKAIEIMDQPQEARAAFEKIVADAGRMSIAQEAPEEESLGQRLTRASAIASATGEMLTKSDVTDIRKNIGWKR